MACEHKFTILEILQDKFQKGFFKSKLGARIYVMQCENCGTLARETVMIGENTEVVYSLSSVKREVKEND